MTFARAHNASMGPELPDVAQHLFHGAHDPGKVRGVIELRIHPDIRDIEPGDRVKFTVALFNQKTGHKFPTGSAEERMVWLHVEATDSKGNVYAGGGTPAKMQIGDLLGIVVASAVLFFPLALLDKAYHFGSPELPAPQAGLMAMLSKGIVGGDMAWPLVVVGILLGLSMIMIEVKSVMLFSVGMYLPIGTTFAIFLGGIIRWITDKLRDRASLNDAQKARVDNAGVLTASGMIAGEALCGLVIAGLVGSGHSVTLVHWSAPFWAALVALAVLVFGMIKVPLANAGSPDEPAPPTAIM